MIQGIYYRRISFELIYCLCYFFIVKLIAAVSQKRHNKLISTSSWKYQNSIKLKKNGLQMKKYIINISEWDFKLIWQVAEKTPIHMKTKIGRQGEAHNVSP